MKYLVAIGGILLLVVVLKFQGCGMLDGMRDRQQKRQQDRQQRREDRWGNFRDRKRDEGIVPAPNPPDGHDGQQWVPFRDREKRKFFNRGG